MNAQLPFVDRLAAVICLRQTPVLVGLDPRIELLPDSFANSVHGTAAQIAEAYRTFCCEVVDVVAPVVAIVKPQAAFFEELGPPGIAALAEVIAHARQSGLLVILDAKRGDIGSTAAAYARGLLGPGQGSGLAADAITVNPYLGPDSLEPFITVAAARQSGIFVLVKTSNPGSGALQDLVAAGRTIYQHVADEVERSAQATVGTRGYGLVGAVVGATYPEQIVELRRRMPHVWMLVPGYGKQGGTAADVAGAFADDGLGAIINSSRDIIFAHRRREYAARFGDRSWQDAVQQATRDMIAALADATPAARLRTQ